MDTYIITWGTGSGTEASVDPQDWRDVLSGAKSVQWANLYKNRSLAATWVGGALSVSDSTTTNGIDPTPQ